MADINAMLATVMPFGKCCLDLRWQTRRYAENTKRSRGLVEGCAALRKGFARLHEGFAGLREGFAGLHEGFAGLREGFAGLHEGFAVLREGFSAVREACARLREGFAALREGFARLHEAFSARVEGVSVILCLRRFLLDSGHDRCCSTQHRQIVPRIAVNGFAGGGFGDWPPT